MARSKAVSQEQLDSTQYAIDSILHYEAIFGEDFVSPGGREMVVELFEGLALAPGSRVLDVGCGLGGSAFVMAREFDLYVDGVDLSKNMLELANAKLSVYGLADRITLEWGDCLALDRPEQYDAIYSRDVFLHIADKARLFSVLKGLLRPGGKLLFTDYCCGEKPWSDDFSAYVKGRGYSLHTLPDYAALISQAGFEQVVYKDLTSRFVGFLRADLNKIPGLALTGSAQVAMAESWKGKLARAESGDHRWGLFHAVKGN